MSSDNKQYIADNESGWLVEIDDKLTFANTVCGSGLKTVTFDDSSAIRFGSQPAAFAYMTELEGKFPWMKGRLAVREHMWLSAHPAPVAASKTGCIHCDSGDKPIDGNHYLDGTDDRWDECTASGVAQPEPDKIAQLNVTVIIADPRDPECKVEVKFELCDRTNLITDAGVVGNVAREFERMLYGE